jgi:hypothetical protein
LFQRRLPPLGDLHRVHLELRSQLAQSPSPRIASIATRALNFGLCCFRVVVTASPASTTPPKA